MHIINPSTKQTERKDKMNNQANAIQILAASGFTASISSLQGCITVKDPVVCRSGGQAARIEYEDRTINVTSDMKRLFKFIIERE